MSSVLETSWLLPGQAQISFVHQGGALQRVVGALISQVPVGQAAQFVVYQGYEGVKSFLIAGLPLSQQFADGLGRDLRHVPTPRC